MSALHRLRGGRRGQSMVEFAMLTPVLLLLVFGFVDVGRAYYQYIALTSAVREAARFEAVNFSQKTGTLPNGTLSKANPAPADTVQGVLQSVARSAGVTVINDATHIKVTFYTSAGAPCAHWDFTTNAVVLDGTCDNDHPRTGDLVKVTGAYDFKVTVPIVSQATGATFNLSSDAEARVE